jgi:hypothetical protein
MAATLWAERKTVLNKDGFRISYLCQKRKGCSSDEYNQLGH